MRVVTIGMLLDLFGRRLDIRDVSRDGGEGFAWECEYGGCMIVCYMYIIMVGARFKNIKHGNIE